MQEREEIRGALFTRVPQSIEMADSLKMLRGAFGGGGEREQRRGLRCGWGSLLVGQRAKTNKMKTEMKKAKMQRSAVIRKRVNSLHVKGGVLGIGKSGVNKRHMFAGK